MPRKIKIEKTCVGVVLSQTRDPVKYITDKMAEYFKEHKEKPSRETIEQWRQEASTPRRKAYEIKNLPPLEQKKFIDIEEYLKLYKILEILGLQDRGKGTSGFSIFYALRNFYLKLMWLPCNGGTVIMAPCDSLPSGSAMFAALKRVATVEEYETIDFDTLEPDFPEEFVEEVLKEYRKP